ncbi:Clp protease/crotonase-like domain-containing protein [Streptomyces sp. NPDC001714]|uniref:hypothetical protein n=1 Tax=Streptomyces sp. NPDC001714 TaxID=3364603 RepID=UPI0036B1A388
MGYDACQTLRVSQKDGVAHVTIDNPPINVLGVSVMTDLRRLLTTPASDATVRVIVSTAPTRISSSPTST